MTATYKATRHVLINVFLILMLNIFVNSFFFLKNALVYTILIYICGTFPVAWNFDSQVYTTIHSFQCNIVHYHTSLYWYNIIILQTRILVLTMLFFMLYCFFSIKSKLTSISLDFLHYLLSLQCWSFTFIPPIFSSHSIFNGSSIYKLNNVNLLFYILRIFLPFFEQYIGMQLLIILQYL